MDRVSYLRGWIDLLSGVINGGAGVTDREKTHQIVILLIVNAWLFSGVANTLQERRFSCISTSDNEDAKASIFLSSIKSFFEVEDSHVGGSNLGTVQISLMVDKDTCWRNQNPLTLPPFWLGSLLEHWAFT